MARNKQHSDFWANNFLDNLEYLKSKNLDLEVVQQLNRIRESIANFVNILTGEEIRVVFKNDEQGMSYFARGKRSSDSYIVISSDVSGGNFDSTVGLACHEATHVVRTDMKLFATDFKELPEHQRRDFQSLIVNSKMYKNLQKKKASQSMSAIDIVAMLWPQFGHKVLNWIEDRVIDNWQYNESPGYRGYYVALYDRYFFSPDEAKILLSTYATDPSLDSYMYRFMTMMHPKANLAAIPGLQEMYDLVDLPNISRLISTRDSWDLAVSVMKIMLTHIEDLNLDQKNSDSGEGECDSEGRTIIVSPDASGMPGSGSPMKLGPNDKVIVLDPKNKKQMDDFQKLFEKSMELKNKMLENASDKEEVSKEYDQLLKNLEDSTVDIEQTNYNGGGGSKSSYSRGASGPDNTSKTIVVNRVTDAVRKSDTYSRFFGGSSHYRTTNNNAAVDEGIRQGKLLAKKIQVRTDARVTPFTHQKRGKLDSRRIHGIFSGQKNIFYKVETDNYVDVNLWVSLDASGSMSGVWAEVIKLIVTIGYAASHIQGMNVVIDVRGETNGSTTYPCTVVVYDSKRDHLHSFLSLARSLYCGSGTPEGLCIRGIESSIPRPTAESTSYFINISDGQPYMGSFNGTNAVDFTKKLMRRLKMDGIGILGYFISTGYGGWDTFKTMYGAKESTQLSAGDVGQIARTINKMLLNKAG